MPNIGNIMGYCVANGGKLVMVYFVANDSSCYGLFFGEWW